MDWVIERYELPVVELHGLGVPENPPRTIRWCVPTNGALVLGSAQPESDADLEALQREGLDLVRRKSGGGAVLVEPGDLAWVDVILPRHDPLWLDDVGRAFHWLGGVWKQALEVAGLTNVTMHHGPMVNSEWSRKICFAGLGPGECLVDGRKVLGISQKRTREAAWFQCSVFFAFRTERIVGLLHASDEDKERMRNDVDAFVDSIDTLPEVIERAFVGAVRDI
jgi:lipoate---protein ligase